MLDLMICHCPRTIEPRLAYEMALQENPANAPQTPGTRRKRSVAYFDKFWAPGRTLRISFTNEPEPSLKDAVFNAACQWLPYVNLDFVLVDDDFDSEIKIHTGGSPLVNYSVFGTDALTSAGASMVLGVTPDMDDFERTVIHEFGHALGAEHEHQHPAADIPWDIPKVYAHYAVKGHSKEVVDEAVLSKVVGASIRKTPYDRHSIMHYPVPQELTLGDWEIGVNDRISDKDKAFMRLAYPR
ncbi:peptidase M12 [Pseudomonas capeferrum]|uniref:peptidase M12 n=1 Tax=Pseudomonas capeferrum TaxID=1495066 RepID=UPI0015E2F801|nr:peptidase M12 [Pseudomonas capeferrum]MBA1201325.1 peptidase M12 [Pseudomonas capeferrum]